MGKDTRANDTNASGNDPGNSSGGSGSVESDDGLRIVVGGGDDSGNDGGSGSGDGSGDSGGSGGSGIQPTRAERKQRNRDAHAQTGSGARRTPVAGKKKTAPKKPTPVSVRERRAGASREKTSAIPAPALGDLAGVVFTMTAVRKGQHWKLQPEEQEAFGEALANVMRHVPMPEKELGIAAEIAALGFTSYAIIMPRIEYDRQLLAAGAPRATAPPRPVAVPNPPRPAPEPVAATPPVQAPEPVIVGGGDGTPLPLAESEIFAGTTDPGVISRLPIG